jgi:KRAB domain-containing zinc finger protein
VENSDAVTELGGDLVSRTETDQATVYPDVDSVPEVTSCDCTYCTLSANKKTAAPPAQTETNTQPFMCTFWAADAPSSSPGWKIYSTPKPFRCRHCEQRFADSAGLLSHVDRKHCGSPDCETMVDSLAHVSIRSPGCSSDEPSQPGEKMHACKHCGTEFVWFSTMIGHVRRDHTRRAFACYCGRKFSTMTSLRCHAAVHTDGKRFKCRQCDKAFRHLYSIRLHTRHHAYRVLIPRNTGI